MCKLLFVDTETGGINPQKHSLLSVGLVAWEDHEIVAEKEILLTNTVIQFTPEALGINNIDFKSHFRNAVSPVKAKEIIIDFCAENFPNDEKITIAGHNVNFDVGFLKKLLGQNYNKIFSHRTLDTSSVLKFLFVSKLLDEDLSSSDKAFDFFGVNIEKRHSALGDAVGTARLFNKLINRAVSR